MTHPFTFETTSIRLDEHYHPSDNTRATTNFANLARGENRRENLLNVIRMIDERCNALAQRNNPGRDRYAVELDIISASLDVAGDGNAFPAIEILKPTILDRATGTRIDGIAGNNFSSYVRDYDFSIVLPRHNAGRASFAVPDGFGALHGRLFTHFIGSSAYGERSNKPPVICLSVSAGKVYRRTDTQHPVLGIEYRPDSESLTERYFGQMQLKVRYFMPDGSVAPLAFFCSGDLGHDYTDLELVGTIATMETFQRIYRPDIYNANRVAPDCFRPSLQHPDYTPTRITYDREERARLAVQQGAFAEQNFMLPHRAVLDSWLASTATEPS